MRLGVVSDAHDRLLNVERIVEAFRGAKVDAVVHTGDITLPMTLARFARVEVPVFGVPGNNDHDREGLDNVAERLGMTLEPRTLEIELGGRRVFVVHDPEDVDLGELCSGDGSPELVLHGHTHRHRWARSAVSWVFNPGECAGFVEGLGSVGVLDLRNMSQELLSV